MARKKASFSSFIFGMLFGIIALLGAVAFAGYWAYNNLTIGHVEQLSGSKFDFIAEDSILRTKAIKDFAGDIKGLPEMDIQTFASNYGINFPAEISFLTDALGDVKIKEIPNSAQIIAERVKLGYIFGSPYNNFTAYPDDYDGAMPDGAESVLWTLRTYTITGSNGISTLADNMTVEDVRDVFGLTLPSFLETEEILQSPLADLGTMIDNMAVTSLFDAPASDDTMGERILLKIMGMTIDDGGTPRPYRLNEVSQLLTDLPQQLTIQDLLGSVPPDDSTPGGSVLRELWDENFTLDELSTQTQVVVDGLYITDLFNMPTNDTMGDRILTKMLGMTKENTDDPDYGEERPYRLGEANELFSNLSDVLKLSDLIDEPYNADEEEPADMGEKILHDLWEDNERMEDLSTDVKNLINGLTLKYFIADEPDQSTAGGRIFYKIWDKNPGINDMEVQITSAINELTIRDILVAAPDTSTAYGRILNVLYDYTYIPDGETEVSYLRLTDIGNVAITFNLADILPAPGADYTPTNNLLRFLIDGNYEIDEIEEALNDMTIADLFGTDEVWEERGGILSLLPPDTLVKDLESTLTTSMGTMTIQQLIDAGVIADISNNTIKGLTLNEVIQSFDD